MCHNFIIKYIINIVYIDDCMMGDLDENIKTSHREDAHKTKPIKSGKPLEHGFNQHSKVTWRFLIVIMNNQLLSHISIL